MSEASSRKKAAAIKAVSAEISRRLKIEAEEDAKPCKRPFCVNKRFHLSGSGKCKFAPKPEPPKCDKPEPTAG